MELRHLRAFCVVAQEMHVTKAAKRLGIAQPALTQQMHLLEKNLGFSLFGRSGRGISLTEAGVFFHKEAEGILTSLHNACLKSQEIARGESGHIRVGVTEGASFDPTLASVFIKFRVAWPSVHLTFTQKQTLELASDLRNGLIDVAFMCPLPDPTGITVSRLYNDSMLLALPSSHPLATRTSVHVRELKDEPFILISHGETEQSLESTFKAACLKEGFTPRILQTTPDFMLALNLVASRLGLSFVPKYMKGIHLGAISYLQIDTSVSIAMKTVIGFVGARPLPAVANLSEIALRTFKI